MACSLPSTTGDTSSASEPHLTSILHLDEATVFMILSCYCRLTDIYMSIFQSMQVCMNNPTITITGQEYVVLLPRLQIGTYASPPIHLDSNTAAPSSAISMYMLIITMLFSQLYDQLAAVTTSGVSSNDLGREEKRPSPQRAKSRGAVALPERPSLTRSSFTDRVQHAVTSRTDRLSQTTDTTRQMLQHFCIGSE